MLRSFVIAAAALSLSFATAHARAQDNVLPLPAADRQLIDTLLGAGVVGKALPSVPIDTPTRYFPLEEKSRSYTITSGKNAGQTHRLAVGKGQRPGGNPAWRFQLSSTLAGFLHNTVEGDLLMPAVTDTLTRWPCPPAASPRSRCA
jgi:hypothetical protein